MMYPPPPIRYPGGAIGNPRQQLHRREILTPPPSYSNFRDSGFFNQIGHALSDDESSQAPDSGFYGHVATLTGSTLWVHGGYDGKKMLQDLWVYDFSEYRFGCLIVELILIELSLSRFQVVGQATRSRRQESWCTMQSYRGHLE